MYYISFLQFYLLGALLSMIIMNGQYKKVKHMVMPVMMPFLMEKNIKIENAFAVVYLALNMVAFCLSWATVLIVIIVRLFMWWQHRKGMPPDSV